MLYIVATPIGNLEDITLRAIKTLQEVDYIACEDTRHSLKLLQRYEIKKPLVSYHSHSGTHKQDQILDYLEAGKTVALISDAGTPGISDPAYKLVKEAIDRGIKVIPIPGASAVLTALVASGLHMHHFLYLGFLPLKKGRQTLFKKLATSEYTMVVYESPHRILKTLTDIKTYMGNRKIAIGRELTKLHEQFLHTDVQQALEHFKKTAPKGEFTLVISADTDYNDQDSL